MGSRDGPPLVWQWMAGGYSGVSVSLGRAQEAAGKAMQSTGEPALVEGAWLMYDERQHCNAYFPTGRRYAGHIGQDKAPVWEPGWGA